MLATLFCYLSATSICWTLLQSPLRWCCSWRWLEGGFLLMWRGAESPNSSVWASCSLWPFWDIRVFAVCCHCLKELECFFYCFIDHVKLVLEYGTLSCLPGSSRGHILILWWKGALHAVLGSNCEVEIRQSSWCSFVKGEYIQLLVCSLTAYINF